MNLLKLLPYLDNHEIADILEVLGVHLSSCLHCAGRLPSYTRDRRRKYCSRSCQMKAYRRRRASKVAAMRRAGMGEYVGLQWKDYRTPFPWEERSNELGRDPINSMRWVD